MAKNMLTRLVVIAVACTASARAIAAENLDANLRFYGRWDRRQPDRAITVNGGSYIVARFDGRAVTARFDLGRNKPPLPTIAWRIDGDDVQWRESEIAAAVELEKDLKPGTHTMQLIIRGLDEHQPRWAEPLTASATFLGFDLPNRGKLIEPPADPKLKIEFLGDSITEGVLVHGKEPGRDTWPWQTDAIRAYPMLTAMKLGAQWRQVGFGAIGLTRGGSGGVPPAPESFDWFYQGCPRDDWQPDVVVVNLGTNDGAAKSEEFRPVYAKYLAQIRKAYPDAHILALRPFAGIHADDVKAEVAARNAAGDAQVSVVDTTGWLERTDFTDRVHPNVGAGPKVGERLSKAIGAVAPAAAK
jgi:lysophospholipase L1-like esterase